MDMDMVVVVVITGGGGGRYGYDGYGGSLLLQFTDKRLV